MKRFIAAALFIYFINPAQALQWQFLISSSDDINKKNQIEYEIATTPSFESKALIDQGFSSTKDLKGDLEPGLYYLRYRKAKVNSQDWTKPIELLVTQETESKILEPSNSATIESPTSKSDVFFRWKKVPGASYQLILSNDQKSSQIKIPTNNPFATQKLNYGKWNARVNIYFGPKLISATPIIDFELKPHTNVGVEFIKPSNDDVVEADKKLVFQISRSYEAEKSLIQISKIGSASQQIFLEKELSPDSNEITIPPLTSGTYQISIEDQLNSESSVESNMRIFVENDPLERHSRGSKTEAELSLGFLLGEISQRNHYNNDKTFYSESDFNGPMIEINLKNKYFDPYNLEFNTELYDLKYDLNSNNFYTNKEPHVKYSMDLLYDLKLFNKPNALLIRSGLFWKSFHQITSTMNDSLSPGSQFVVQKSANLLGLNLGIDFEWKSFSTTWSMATYIKTIFPLISLSDQINSGSISKSPSYETGINFKKKISEYVHLSFTPLIKSERWLINKSKNAPSPSVQIASGFGFNLGLMIEI